MAIQIGFTSIFTISLYIYYIMSYTKLHTGYKHDYFNTGQNTKIDLHNMHTRENTQGIHETRHGHVPYSRKEHSFQSGTTV
jgi:hypothetical protein